MTLKTEKRWRKHVFGEKECIVLALEAYIRRKKEEEEKNEQSQPQDSNADQMDQEDDYAATESPAASVPSQASIPPPPAPSQDMDPRRHEDYFMGLEEEQRRLAAEAPDNTCARKLPDITKSEWGADISVFFPSDERVKLRCDPSAADRCQFQYWKKLGTTVSPSKVVKTLIPWNNNHSWHQK